MERVIEGGAAATTMRSTTLQEVEAFHRAEYQYLVKIVILFGASMEEAEDAVQKAMLDFAQRRIAGQVIDHPRAYVQKAAVNSFVKERKRDRERMPRELQDWDYVKYLLEPLTSAQREVMELVAAGLSTSEIAERLGKTHPNVRQLLKQSRGRLVQHPEIAALASRVAQRSRPARGKK